MNKILGLRGPTWRNDLREFPGCHLILVLVNLGESPRRCVDEKKECPPATTALYVYGGCIEVVTINIAAGEWRYAPGNRMGKPSSHGMVN